MRKMGALKIKEERGKDGDVLKGEKNAMTAINMVSVLIFCSIKNDTCPNRTKDVTEYVTSTTRED
jgi:hypothetical protein